MIQTTEEYFSIGYEELLKTTNENDYTKEERLLFDLGLNCTFFDDLEEYELEKKTGFEDWLLERNMIVLCELETINGRIAVVSK